MIFGDGCANSFDTCAVGVAFGFGLSARGAESVEAGLGGAFAMGSPSGLIACGAADGAAVFGSWPEAALNWAKRDWTALLQLAARPA